MSQYMQESGSYINPYYSATSQNSFANNGAESPTAAAAAIAAYYGTAGAGFGAGAAGSAAPGAGMAAAGYASYYNNLVAGYYPGHQSGYTYGSSAGAGNVAHSGANPDDYSRRHTPGPVYHLNTALPPPSLVESGTNSLDDILKTPSKTMFFSYFQCRYCLIHFFTKQLSQSNLI